MDTSWGRLRPLEERDLKKVLDWRNSERIRQSMLSDHLISWEEHWHWFTNMNQDRNSYLLFEFQEQPAGLVYFNDIDRYHNKACWGFYVGETELPRGTGLLMGYLGLSHAFSEQAFRKICSEALFSNPTSISFHIKLGFVEEGRLIQQVRKGENYVDLILLALFNEQWQQNQNRIREFIAEY